MFWVIHTPIPILIFFTSSCYDIYRIPDLMNNFSLFHELILIVYRKRIVANKNHCFLYYELTWNLLKQSNLPRIKVLGSVVCYDDEFKSFIYIKNT